MHAVTNSSREKQKRRRWIWVAEMAEDPDIANQKILKNRRKRIWAK